MTTVRTLAKRRQRRRPHYAAGHVLQPELTRRYGVPADVLLTFAGVSDPANRQQFTVTSLGEALARGATRITMPKNAFGQPQPW
jgi:hypothetical protein